MSATNIEYKTILSQVRRWPIEKRIALLEDVLHTLTPVELPEVTQSKDTFSRALGLLNTGGNTLSDDEIEIMLTNRRLEKYG